MFLHLHWSPFDWLTQVIECEGACPIFTYRSVQSHVETMVTFYFRMDNPVWPLNSQITFIKQRLTPLLFKQVFTSPYCVNKRNEQIVYTFIFKLTNWAICKWWCLIFVLDQKVFIITKIYQLTCILNIKLTFFIHMYYPCILVSINSAWGLVQCTGFEQRSLGAHIVLRYDYLVHICIFGTQVHLVVSDDLDLPVGISFDSVVSDHLLNVNQWVAYLLRVYAFRHEADVYFGFIIFTTEFEHI